MIINSWFNPNTDTLTIYIQDCLTPNISLIISHSKTKWIYKLNQIEITNPASIQIVHPPQTSNLTVTAIDLNNVVVTTTVKTLSKTEVNLWETTGVQYGTPEDLKTVLGNSETILTKGSSLQLDEWNLPIDFTIGTRYIEDDGKWGLLDKRWIPQQLWIEQAVENYLYNTDADTTFINTKLTKTKVVQDGLTWDVLDIHHDFTTIGEVLFTFPSIPCTTNMASSIIFKARDIYGDSKAKIYLELLWYNSSDILLQTDQKELFYTDTNIVGLLSDFVSATSYCIMRVKVSDIKNPDHLQLNIAFPQLQAGNFITTRTSTKQADLLKANCNIELYGSLKITTDSPYSISPENYTYLWSTPNSFCRLNASGQLEWDGLISGGIDFKGKHTIECKWSNQERIIFIDNIELISNSLMPIMADTLICIGTDINGNHALNAKILDIEIT